MIMVKSKTDPVLVLVLTLISSMAQWNLFNFFFMCVPNLLSKKPKTKNIENNRTYLILFYES